MACHSHRPISSPIEIAARLTDTLEQACGLATEHAAGQLQRIGQPRLVGYGLVGCAAKPRQVHAAGGRHDSGVGRGSARSPRAGLSRIGHHSGARSFFEEWREGVATFTPKCRSIEAAATRRVVLPVSVCGAATRATMIEHSSHLRPRHVLAGGFADGGARHGGLGVPDCRPEDWGGRKEPRNRRRSGILLSTTPWPMC